MSATQTSPTPAPAATPSPTSQDTFTGAAGLLTAGLAGLLLGTAAVIIGLMVNAASFSGDGGGIWLLLGGLAWLVGAVLALSGLYVLLQHLDDWARDRHRQSRH